MAFVAESVSERPSEAHKRPRLARAVQRGGDMLTRHNHQDWHKALRWIICGGIAGLYVVAQFLSEVGAFLGRVSGLLIP
jgi:hypothetical protein